MNDEQQMHKRWQELGKLELARIVSGIGKTWLRKRGVSLREGRQARNEEKQIRVNDKPENEL